MRLPPLFALFLACLALTAQAGEAPLKVAVTPWMGDIGAAVAMEQGLWKKLGLEVEVVNYQDDEDFRAAIKGGAIDLGFDMTASTIDMIRKGTDIVLYAETDWSHGGDKVIVAKGVTAKSLVGGTVGIYDEGAAVNLVLDAWLKREGVDPAKVERLVLEDEALANAFIAGKVTAMINYEPQAGRAIKDGNGVVAATTADFPGIMPEGLAGKRSIPPARLQLFFTGLLQGVAFAKDPANLKAVTAAANVHLFPTDPQKEEEVAAQLTSMRLHGPAEIVERNAGEAGVQAFVAQVLAWNAAHELGKTDMTGRIDTAAVLAAARALAGK